MGKPVSTYVDSPKAGALRTIYDVTSGDDFMAHWWNDADSGSSKYWEKNLSQCHFVHYKFHME
jgi:hypothetical protein